MTHNTPKIKLYFEFHGEHFDPDEITKRLGIEPTISFRPGDPITKDGHGKRRGYGWMVKIADETFKLDDLLPEFRQRLNLPPETVKQLCHDLNVELVISCGVGLGGAEVAPGLYFPTEFLEWITDLGGSLDVDIVW